MAEIIWSISFAPYCAQWHNGTVASWKTIYHKYKLERAQPFLSIKNSPHYVELPVHISSMCWSKSKINPQTCLGMVGRFVCFFVLYAWSSQLKIQCMWLVVGGGWVPWGANLWQVHPPIGSDLHKKLFLSWFCFLPIIQIYHIIGQKAF